MNNIGVRALEGAEKRSASLIAVSLQMAVEDWWKTERLFNIFFGFNI